jgi:hypothetical protein
MPQRKDKEEMKLTEKEAAFYWDLTKRGQGEAGIFLDFLTTAKSLLQCCQYAIHESSGL